MYLSLFLGLDYNHKEDTAHILLIYGSDIWKQKEVLQTPVASTSHRNV